MKTKIKLFESREAVDECQAKIDKWLESDSSIMITSVTQSSSTRNTNSVSHLVTVVYTIQE